MNSSVHPNSHINSTILLNNPTTLITLLKKLKIASPLRAQQLVNASFPEAFGGNLLHCLIELTGHKNHIHRSSFWIDSFSIDQDTAIRLATTILSCGLNISHTNLFDQTPTDLLEELSLFPRSQNQKFINHLKNKLNL